MACNTSITGAPMDYERFLNYYGRRVEPSTVRTLGYTFPKDVDKRAAAGLPHPSTFPFSGMTFDLRDGTKLQFTEKELEIAQQYGKTDGYDPLLDLLYEMQCAEHHPPTAGQAEGPSRMRMLMSPGGQMALTTIALLCSREDVPLLLHAPSFTLISAPLVDVVNQALCIEIDAEGSNPASLRKLLSRWKPEDAKNPDSDIPRVMILNPTCNNPSGVTTTLERRKEIYSIAQEYDLLIVEDDPYYYLQEQTPRVPSYLSLDVDGRVVRIDSFSKIVAPGLRCAFVTGPAAIVNKIEYIYMETCQQTCCLSQVAIHKLLEHWGPKGFEDHVQEIKRFNREKRLHALAMLDKWLTGLAEWDVPTGGIFILLKVRGTGLTSTALNAKLVAAHKFTFIPADDFHPKGAKPEGVALLRVSVPFIDKDMIERAFKGLAGEIRDAKLRRKTETL